MQILSSGRLHRSRRIPARAIDSLGDSYDNVLAETINGLCKTEVIWRQRSWPSASAVEMATLRWVDWFNNHRLFGSIGHFPPAEAEANYYAAIDTLGKRCSQPTEVPGMSSPTRLAG